MSDKQAQGTTIAKVAEKAASSKSKAAEQSPGPGSKPVDRPADPTGKPGDDIDRLGTMRVGELQALLAELTGEKSRSPNRVYLVRRIMEAAVLPMALEGEPAGEAVATGTAEPKSAASQIAPSAAQGPRRAPQNEEATTNATPEPDATTDHPAANPIVKATAVPVTASQPSRGATTDQKLPTLDIQALQALYAEVTGRQTCSVHRNSLIYRIRQAQKGGVPLGPRASRRQDGGKAKVLPLRMEASLVHRLDEARLRLGLRSRMDLIRTALQSCLAAAGETELAEQL